MLNLLNKLIFFFEQFYGSYWFSYIFRLRKSDQINATPDVRVFDQKIAIVMQGPVIERNDFTLETLKLYRKRFPFVPLILSTWDDLNEKVQQKFEACNVQVIKNKKPDNSGVSNINFQIVSAKNGLLMAKELGMEYCLRTRTDQRLYKHDFISFFLSVLKTFPINSKQEHLNNRLIVPSLNTYKYRLYNPTDMLMFGSMDDMLLYWDCELDDRSKVEDASTLKDWSKLCYTEVYLLTNFLKKINHKIEWTLEDSWKVFAEYFCIVDKESLDLFWYKYDRTVERRAYSNEFRHAREELYFSDWLNLYTGNLKSNDKLEKKVSSITFNSKLEIE